jgi:HEAT repeat protein
MMFDSLFKPNIQKLKDKRDVPGLIKALQNNDPLIFQKAVEALGQIGDPRAVEPLSAALKMEGPYNQAPDYAAEALGKIGDPRAVDPLIAALNDDREHVRMSAASAIEKIGAPAVEPLITALKVGGKYPRLYAAEILGKFGGLRAVEPLIATLRDTDHYVRCDVIEALGKIGDPRAIEPLIATLKDAEESVRETAIEALRKIGQSAIEPLIATFTDETFINVKGNYKVYDALAQIGAPAVEPLSAALKDDKETVREGAAITLSLIKSGRTVEPLIAALKDKNFTVRVYAIKALGKNGDPRAVEPLSATLKDPEWHVRENAADALGEIGDARAVQPLIAALSEVESHIVLAAGNAVGNIGVPALESLIYVRKSFVDALDKLGWQPDQGTAGAAYQIARNNWERCVQIGAPAVEPLIAALKDRNSGVRKLACEALGKIGDARAVEPLIAASKDAIESVRNSAAEALKQIDKARTTEAPKEAGSTDTTKESIAQDLRSLGNQYPGLLPYLKVLADSIETGVDPKGGKTDYREIASVLGSVVVNIATQMRFNQAVPTLQKLAQAINQLAEKSGGSALGFAVQGQTFINQEKFDEAIDVLQKALEIDPDDEADARYNLGVAYLRKSLKDEISGANKLSLQQKNDLENNAEDCWKQTLLRNPQHNLAKSALEQLADFRRQAR